MSLGKKRIVWPLSAGIAGASFLTAVYFGIMSLAEGPRIALQLFWQDRWYITPILLGFGTQAALYTILKKRLFMSVEHPGPSGKMMGASGSTSTFAMVACCAHHVTDALPFLGLNAAATFLAQYRTTFLLVGLGSSVVGIAAMLNILYRERHRAIQMMSASEAL